MTELLERVVGLATAMPAEPTSQDVLARLVEHVVQLLPVTAAGVRLRDGGPCEHALAAADAGLREVVSLPLRSGGSWLGDLELYAPRPVELTSTELEAARALADVAAALLLIARRGERAAAETALLAKEALHDALTGLPNRRLLWDRLEQAMSRSRRSRRAFAVVFCDIDGFKDVNDRFGHRVGDQLLIEVARRLREILRPHDTLARVAGDEFVLVCEHLSAPAHADRIADRILAVMDPPFPLEGGVGPEGGLALRMSVGVALAGVRGGTPEQAMARADAAMYRVKRLGGDGRSSSHAGEMPVTRSHGAV
jgi:diguanylate cyclase (GGDEF)-like protein